MIGILKTIFGDKSKKDLEILQPIVDQVNEVTAKITNISNDELRAKSVEFQQRIADFIKSEQDQIKELKKKVDDTADIEEKETFFEKIDQINLDIDKKLEEVLKQMLPETFAVIKETAKRFSENQEMEVTATDFDKQLASKKGHIQIKGDKAIWKNKWLAAGNEVTWNMVHYDVQLMGGFALHSGKIAEMATGEGKTLVATLPVYSNALTGKGVHLVTVNDYLAKRDSEWMAPLYEFHGLSVDCIDKYQPNSDERRKAYEADITFGTNNEFGFDYLRDNMSSNVDELVQKKHHYAIIDEVDSVLIDDARTPLIISGPSPKGDQHEYFQLKPKVERLVNAQRKLLTTVLADAKKDLKILEDENADKKLLAEKTKSGGLSLLRVYRGLPKNKALIKFLSEPGIRTQLQKTENFYLQDQQKQMPTVDKELYFVIDEKNNSIELTEKGLDLISGSENPDLFILPDISSKISEIEKSDLEKGKQIVEKEKLIQDYSQRAERIHTINQLLKAYTLFEKEVEYVLMDGKVKIVDEQTGRIMEGRRFSDGLHQALEAKEDVKVEAITQTYATITLQNYFRMYHKLSGMTGTAETEAKELWDIYELDVVVIPTNKPILRDDRQDMVFKTAREKYNAIIDEVAKLREDKRPILVGTTTVEISELLSRMLNMRNIPHQVLNAKLHQKEADIVAEAGKPGTVTIATNMAGRGTDIKLGEGVKDSGGLAIIGTERHDSRRVDRQLRGRAGRQGDPGSSQFFVSLEDHLMRLFGSERIAKLMDRMGLKEGEVIQHSMITKSIERAQKKVEENNFGIRKRLLEYDDVMNAQRKAIYQRRKNALYGERLDLDVANMFYEVIEEAVASQQAARDFESFNMELIKNFAIESPVSEDDFFGANPAELTNTIYHQVWKKYNKKGKAIGDRAFPVIKNVYENESGQYKNIVIPFSDGSKTLNILVDLEEAYNKQGTNTSKEAEKSVVLATIDAQWKDHLRTMDDLRQSVQQASYEQKDPLLIYKLESFELFKQMMNKVNTEAVSFLAKSSLPIGDGEQSVTSTNQERPRGNQNELQTSHSEIPQYGAGGGNSSSATAPPQQRQKVQPVIREEKKIGRNEKVDIYNIVTNEAKTVKFKVAEPLIESGQWRIKE